MTMMRKQSMQSEEDRELVVIITSEEITFDNR